MLFPKLFLIPLAVGFITFGLKIIIKAIKGDFTWEVSATYGGMPSIHTAFVVSLCTVVVIAEGIFSVAFAISIIFSLLIIRDAVGFRRYLGVHSEILNELVQKNPKAKEKYPKHLNERLGHTIPEAIVGGMVGFVLTVMLYIITP